MAKRTEPVVNALLAQSLIARHPQWDGNTVRAETTGLLQGGAGLRPDILVTSPGHQPVCVETEFTPAATVEDDARARLGATLAATGDAVEGVLAVRLPEDLATDGNASTEDATYEYAALQLGADGTPSRYPEDGGITGNADDLADAVEHLSLSESQLAKGTAALERAVAETAGQIEKHLSANAQEKLAALLHQSAGEQTNRMAGAIFTSAFVFHAAIEDQDEMPSLGALLPPMALSREASHGVRRDLPRPEGPRLPPGERGLPGRDPQGAGPADPHRRATTRREAPERPRHTPTAVVLRAIRTRRQENETGSR